MLSVLLSVIIVNYNVKYFLEQCLYSVGKAIQSIDAEVIVVDNASGDGSLSYLQPRFPYVTFIGNNENSGFAKANNLAWKMATGKYILFLNPDTILAEDSLLTCLQFMEAHPKAGACGVRMLDGKGRFLPESKRGFPGLAPSLYKLSGLTAVFPRSKRFAHYQLGHLDAKKNHAVDVLSGAFFLAKNAVLQETGSFDEAFFMYGEDIDLSYRIRKAGYLNYYIADTEIIHFKGESTRKDSFNYVKTFYHAMDIFVKKHYPGRRYRPFRTLISIAIYGRGGLSAIKHLFRKSGRTTPRQPGRTFVVGSEKDTAGALAILKRNARPPESMIPLKTEELAPVIARTEQSYEMIFCEGDLSFKTIIRLLQQLPAGVVAGIHAGRSESIVGSSSRTSSGYFLS